MVGADVKKQIVVGSLLMWRRSGVGYSTLHLVIARRKETGWTTLLVGERYTIFDGVEDFELKECAEHWRTLWT